MTTTTEKNKTRVSRRKVLSSKPVNLSTLLRRTKEEKVVGLIALWNAPSPGLFKDVAEVDAHIREGRGDWDDEG